MNVIDRSILVMVCAIFFLFPNFAVATPSFIVDPAGQATTSSCQSYVLALGLGFKKDNNFPILNWSQLRRTETQIRAAIVDAFKKRVPAAGKIDPNHDDVRAGFEKYTSGIYRLKIKDVDIQELSDLVASRTGISMANAVPQNFLLGAVVKDVVMSSAKKIGTDSYGAGHIFTILGMDGPMNSSRKFLILNSAVKKPDLTRNACTEELPDDPGPYSASLSWHSLGDLELKPFGDKFKVWVIEKN